MPRDNSHMCTTESELNSGDVIVPKKRTADARSKRFWGIVFERR